jgi:DNA-directed RNA polymerase specialized sigma24 family protein
MIFFGGLPFFIASDRFPSEAVFNSEVSAMKRSSAEPTPPDPDDLDGWRQAILNRQLSSFRLESIVAALQDLNRDADTRVTQTLTKHLSDALSGMLRDLIGPNHPNDGEDIIAEAHTEIFKSVLQPSSADGRALREAFYPRVKFRAMDAIANEYRDSRVPLVPRKREPEAHEDEEDIPFDKTKAAALGHLLHRGMGAEASEEAGFEGDDAVSNARHPDATLLAVADHIGGNLDTERVLALIPDWRKRFAFRLYMEDIPYGSKKTYSIAKAVGVSSKTVEAWIDEIRRFLVATDQVQELLGKKAGERP